MLPSARRSGGIHVSVEAKTGGRRKGYSSKPSPVGVRFGHRPALRRTRIQHLSGTLRPGAAPISRRHRPDPASFHLHVARGLAMSANPAQPGGVFGSLIEALHRLRNNVTLFVAAFIITLASGSIAFLGFIDPVLSNLSSLIWLFVWPFIIGGFLAMALEAGTGSTQLGTFLRAGKAKYVSMLGATFLFTVIIIGVAFLSMILTFVVILVAIAGAAVGDVLAGDVSFVLLAAVFVVFLLLPYFLVYLFLQFYDAAIVATDEKAIASIGYSFNIVRRNFLPVFGYTVVFFVIQLISYGPAYGVLFFGALEFTDTGEWAIQSEPLLGLGVLLMVMFGTVGMAIAFTYHMTFFESITAGADGTGDSNATVVSDDTDGSTVGTTLDEDPANN